jgi:hypothetical protein
MGMRRRLLAAFYLFVNSDACYQINSHAYQICAISLEDTDQGPFRNETHRFGLKRPDPLDRVPPPGRKDLVPDPPATSGGFATMRGRSVRHSTPRFDRKKRSAAWPTGATL